MTILVKDFGLCDYTAMYDKMRDFSQRRDSYTQDQIWFMEHYPVYTLGLADKKNHLLNVKDIPVVKTDRGGQTTYHGPGQLIAYLLLDLTRRSYKVKKLVYLIEQAIIDYLNDYTIDAKRKQGAPGIYIKEEKIAALGLRIKRGNSYHGLAFNINMNIEPFNRINPCGYKGMKCTQLINFINDISIYKVKENFSPYLIKYLDEPKKLVA